MALNVCVDSFQTDTDPENAHKNIVTLNCRTIEDGTRVVLVTESLFPGDDLAAAITAAAGDAYEIVDALPSS